MEVRVREPLGNYITPNSVTSFVRNFSEGELFKSILDPACGSGALLKSAVSTLEAETVVGVDIDPYIVQEAKDNLKNLSNCNLMNSNFFELNSCELHSFDYVVIDPPYGQSKSQTEECFIKKSIQHLNKEGVLICIIPDGILINRNKGGLFPTLKDYSIEAIISLPERTFYPVGIKASIFIIKNSEQRDRIFFADYKEEKAATPIISNYKNQKSNNNISQGFWVDNQIALSAPDLRYNRFRLLEDYRKLKNTSAHRVVLLSDLISSQEQKINKELIFLRGGFGPKICLEEELEDRDKKRSYFKFKVDDSKVSISYLKLYLTSREGKEQLEFLSSFSFPFRRCDLDYIYVSLPTLSVQNKIVKVEQKLSEVKSKIEMVSKSFSENLFDCDDLTQTINRYYDLGDEQNLYEDNIYPLAVSYRLIEENKFKDNERLDCYFVIFEFLAAFNSCVLLSSLDDDARSDFLKSCWKLDSNQPVQMSFGTWVNSYRTLSKTHNQRAVQDSNDESFHWSKLFKALSDDKIIKVFDEIPKLRNQYGGATHGGITASSVAQRIADEIHPKLLKVLDAFSYAYSSFDLVFPQSMQKKNGIYTINTRNLSGSHEPTKVVDICSEVDMDTCSLHLYEKHSNEALNILSELIKLEQCQECGRWSVFVFSKIVKNKKGKESIFVNYQNDPHTVKAPLDGALLN
jgi:16S rRNA G966 N2-methylase RsmD